MRRRSLARQSARDEPRKLDRHYVSEFARFMNGFLEEHPEVVVDQSRGRAIYWDKQVNLGELQKAQEDTVSVDSYYYFGWPRDKSEGR